MSRQVARLVLDLRQEVARLTVPRDTTVAFGCYLTLLGRIGPARAAYATVLFPIIALMLSTAFEGYRWTVEAFAGVALVLSGNLLVLLPRRAHR